MRTQLHFVRNALSPIAFRLADMSDQYKFRVRFSDGTTEDFDSLEVLPDGLLKVSKAQATSSSLFPARKATNPAVRCYSPHFWQWFDSIEKPTPRR